MPGAVHVNKSLGTRSSRIYLLQAFFHSSEAHLVFLPLTEHGESVVTHELRKTGIACEGGRARTSNRAGGGAFTKGGVSCTVSPFAHAKAEGRERTGHGSNLSLPR